ncbi:MAG: hypothetical protein ABI977_28065, partial [Acidobacteriota bacterium]
MNLIRRFVFTLPAYPTNLEPSGFTGREGGASRDGGEDCFSGALSVLDGADKAPEAMIRAMATAEKVVLPGARFWTEPIHVAAKTLAVRPDVRVPTLLARSGEAI